MSHFVLVPGAWLGAWAWDRVVPQLSAAGHTVHALTLTGLAERSDEGVGEINLDTHAADILAAVDRSPTADVVLVSHSYSGLPVLQAADRLAGQIARIVHVDSVIRTAGSAFLDPGTPWGRQVMSDVARDGGVWAPQLDQLEGQGLSPTDVALVAERATPHPGGSLSQPLHLAHPLSAAPAAYLHCVLDTPELDAQTQALADEQGWQVRHLPTGHWPMLTDPELLAGTLMDTA